jgi:hypothetical protein
MGGGGHMGDSAITVRSRDCIAALSLRDLHAMNSSRFRARQTARRRSAPAAFVAEAVLSFVALAARMASARTPSGVLYNAGETNDVPQRAATPTGIDFFYAIGSSPTQSSLPAVASVTDPMHVPILSTGHELICKGVRRSAMPIYRAVPADYKALINHREMADPGLPVPTSLDGIACFVN